jgi:hypothetical protein
MDEHGLTEKERPSEVHPKKRTLDLRALIWNLIHKKELTEKEITEIEELIYVLKAKRAMMSGHSFFDLWNASTASFAKFSLSNGTYEVMGREFTQVQGVLSKWS